MSLAKAILSGVIVSEPEKRFTPNNHAVTNFTIQVAPASKNESPAYVRVTCWRNLADITAESLHKGNEVVVEGKLQINQYEASGVSKRAYEIDATNVYVGQMHALEAPAGSFDGQQQSAPAKRDNAYATPPMQQQSHQAEPSTGLASVGASKEAFLQDEFLTEDDIPF